MPDVNLLKDTQTPEQRAKKPAPPIPPELTNPSRESSGVGRIFKSLFNRRPKALPVAAQPQPLPGGDHMSLGRNTPTERILSETKRAAPSVIPLPEEDEGSYNVNLLSEDLVTAVDPRKRWMLLGLYALGAIIIVGLGYGSLLLYQKNIKQQITDTQNELTKVRSDISDQQVIQTEAVNTVAKISALQALIDRHNHWTKFFRLIEKYTLKTVTYGPNFSADMTGTISLTATTTSYEEVAKQYLVFDQLVKEGKFLSNFTITGARAASSKDEDGEKVSFVVSITLLPDNFTVTSDEFVASQKESTTPSSDGPLSLDINQEAVQAFEDGVLLMCDLLAQPEDINFLPDFARVDVQRSVAATTAQELQCSSFAAEKHQAAVEKLKTDADRDGINALFEEMYGTRDTTADSGRGTTDAEYVRQQFTGETTPSSDSSATP